MTNPHFLALDIETTGLDPKRDRILEIGLAFVHRQTLEVVAEKSWIVPVDYSSLRMPDPVVLAMHSASGLWAEVETAADAYGGKGYLDEGGRLRYLSDEIRQWATRDGLHKTGRLLHEPGPLLGSSVHFDREFLRHADEGAFASLLNLWTHRNLDVSAIKECAKAWAPDLEVPEPEEAKHRVSADIRNSVRLLDFYRREFLCGDLSPTKGDAP